MAQSNDHYQALIKLLLPDEIFEYFDIVQVDTGEKEVHIHLDEKAIKPEGYELKGMNWSGSYRKGSTRQRLYKIFLCGTRPCFYM